MQNKTNGDRITNVFDLVAVCVLLATSATLSKFPLTTLHGVWSSLWSMVTVLWERCHRDSHLQMKGLALFPWTGPRGCRRRQEFHQACPLPSSSLSLSLVRLVLLLFSRPAELALFFSFSLLSFLSLFCLFFYFVLNSNNPVTRLEIIALG